MQNRKDSEQQTFPPMSTVHIMNINKKYQPGFGFSQANSLTPNTPMSLIKELYQTHLNNDPLFHFFFEPDLIIRISNNEVLENLKKHLITRCVEFVVYAYPIPEKIPGQCRYGENEGGPIHERPDIYLPVFHANAIAALTLSEDEHHYYMERTTHTMSNMYGYTRDEEAEQLAILALKKASGPIAILEEKTVENRNCCSLM